MPAEQPAIQASAVEASAPRIGKLLIVGVGLIGGSFALALRAAGSDATIVGVGRTRANLDAARAMSAIDRGVTLDADWTAELGDADVVMLATPVGQYDALMPAMAPHLSPHTIVTEAGSTKQNVIATARATLGRALSRFVPGHPIAGTEQSGATAAFATLYRDRNVVLTPLPETDANALDVVTALWRRCGARVRLMDAAKHDRIFAAVSHLPHLLAFALVDAFAARPDADDIFGFAASGFRDFTRIAGSSPEMWRDISFANRDALLEEVAAFRVHLDTVAAMIAAGDSAAINAVFSRASAARREWESRQAGSAVDNREGRNG